MTKVSVVTRWVPVKEKATKTKTEYQKEVVGVFSNEKDAIHYCDIKDPAEMNYCIDDFQVDSLVIFEGLGND